MGDEKEKPKTPLQEAGFKEEEEIEIRKDAFTKTGYPKSIKTHRIFFQSEQHNVEEMYHWMLNGLSGDFGLYHVDKITDIMAASTSSSIFGDMGGRLSAQQGQATQLFGTTAKMVMDMFAIVRQLREIEEKLAYYKQADSKEKEIATSAERTLKGIWIDLVEGGTQNPSSVIGLAQKVGFTVLPDLFFDAPPMASKDVEKHVKALRVDFNEHVTNMLGRKLYQFLIWKEQTHKEFQAKYHYQIRFLRHHFDTIRLYLAWLKPYIRQIKMLQMQHNDKNGIRAHMGSGFMSHAFQSSLVELETLFHAGDNEAKDKPQPCVLVHFFYRTSPSMDFHARDAYHQKGPIHVGRTEMTIRAYAWTPEEIEKYKSYRMAEDFNDMVSIDNSLEEAMRLLGDDLKKYLSDAGLEVPETFGFSGEKKADQKEKKKDEEKLSYKSPFVDIFHATRDIVGLFVPLKDLNFFSNAKKEKEAAAKKQKEKDARSKASKTATVSAWLAYSLYKKTHGMITW